MKLHIFSTAFSTACGKLSMKGGENVATKVREANLNSVDFVHSGANQDAHIALFKSKTDEEATLKDSWWNRFINFMKSEYPDTDPEEEMKKSNIAKAKQTIKDENQLYTSVLKESMDSIVFNDELDSAEKYQMMKKSMDEFTETMESAIEKWHNLDSSIEEIEKSLHSEVDPKEPEDNKDPEEPKEPEEREAKEEDMDNKELEKAFQEEMDSLKKNMEELQKKNDMDEMRAIAKKYTILGKNEEELATTLYNMKKSSEDTYGQYVTLLDENLAMVEKSGLFNEIGKSANGGSAYAGTTEAKIEKAAEEIRKSNPTMNYYDSIEKAWEQNPELAAEYEKSYMEGR